MNTPPNSPYASPHTEHFSLPPLKRRRVMSSSSGNEWDVSLNPATPSAEDVSRIATESFSEIGSPYREQRLSPSGPGWQLGNLEEFSFSPRMPGAFPDEFSLHRGSRGASINHSQPFRPCFAPRFNPGKGRLKKPCRYKLESSIDRLDPFLKNALDVQNSSKFQWRGKEFRIEIQNDPESNGQFNIFARIPENQPRVIRGKKNAEIGLKTFRDHCIMLESRYPERVNKDSHLNVLTQYRDLLALKLPVAKIYNEVEAENGCGFFLVEIVPTPFYADWAKGTPIDRLTKQQLIFLKQIKSMFKKSYDAGITPDLQPDNLRVRKKGHLAITDLRERKLSKKEQDLNFRSMLRSFNCEEGDEIYAFLNPMKK